MREGAPDKPPQLTGGPLRRFENWRSNRAAGSYAVVSGNNANHGFPELAAA
jgi:hypothetical protein